MNKIKLLFVIIIFLFTKVYCQNFKVSPLIEAPGDNVEYDILSPEWGMPNSETYICWINKLDSIYTVYLKQLSPISGSDIIVSSDSNIKSRPHIALNRYAQGIKIVWECYEKNTWKVYLKNYYEDQLSESILVLDSLQSDSQISLSTHRLAWIDNGDLLVKEFNPDYADTLLFDSLNCSSPELLKYDYLQSTNILYRKDYIDSITVNMITYQHNENTLPVFKYATLSKGLLSKNPKYGINGEITFESYENDVWKSLYSISSYSFFEITKNQGCNFTNPVLFTYTILISSSSNSTPYFLVFDTDSLADNHEIFIQRLYYDEDSLINISKSIGSDYEPRVTYVSTSDSVFVAIIWEHTESGKTDIWMAKDIFNSPPSAIEDQNYVNQSFKLYQNYPNPFNPATTIEYTIEKSSNVKIIIYDMLGRKVKILVNEFKKTGNYKELFNASKLASGIYYYQLINGESIQTRQMLLLK